MKKISEKKDLLWSTPIGSAILGSSSFDETLELFFGEIVLVLQQLNGIWLKESTFESVTPIEHGKYKRLKVLAEKIYQNTNYLVDLYAEIDAHYQPTQMAEKRLIFKKMDKEYQQRINHELISLKKTSKESLELLETFSSIPGAVDSDAAWVESIFLRISEITQSDFTQSFYDRIHLFGKK